MKVGTTELIKFLKLQRRLGQSKIVIVGLLELLWQGTAKNCPDGDIGRFDNEDIAAMVDLAGDSDELICALIDCKWLDENEIEFATIEFTDFSWEKKLELLKKFLGLK